MIEVEEPDQYRSVAKQALGADSKMSIPSRLNQAFLASWKPPLPPAPLSATQADALPRDQPLTEALAAPPTLADNRVVEQGNTLLQNRSAQAQGKAVLAKFLSKVV